MGYGQVIAREATEWAIAKAKSGGVGIFALRNTHHVARVGTYGELAAAAGLVSIHFVNVLIAARTRRAVRRHGRTFRHRSDLHHLPGRERQAARRARFRDQPRAAGKLRVAMNEGKALPAGYLIESKGNEATGPAVFYRENGAMLPFGEHKGSGLALACELLAGVLTGGGAMQENIPNNGIKNGMFSIVLDPARFGDTGWMEREAATLIDWVKSSPPRPGVEEVLIAGEPERKSREKRLKSGIPVDANTWKELVQAAGQVGLPAAQIRKGSHMTAILVTGAAGQIGSELVTALRQKHGAGSVIASDIRIPMRRRQRDAGPFEPLDCTRPDQVQDVVRRHGITAIYHLAALLSAVAEEKPQAAWSLNIGGLYTVLETARQYRCAVFFPSSIGAFGPTTPRDHTPQDTVQRPTTIYGITKVTGEMLGDYYARRFGVDVRGVRFPGLISHVAPPGGGTTDYAVEIFYQAIRYRHYTCFLRPGYDARHDVHAGRDPRRAGADGGRSGKADTSQLLQHRAR